MSPPRVVCVVLVLCMLGVGVRGDLMSVFTYDYLVGRNLTQRWSGGSIPDFVLDQILDLFAPVSEAVGNPLCRNHSLEYKQAVKDKRLWALYMLESSAIVPNGLMTGNLIQLGNYDGCLDMKDIPTASGRFSGQHCLVTLTDADGAMEAPSNDSVTKGLLDGHLFVSNIRWSMCIPSSCTPRDLETHLRSTLQDMIGDVTLTVGDTACSSREHSKKYTAEDWFAIVFFTFFAVIVVMSTGYDLKYPKPESRSALLKSFSLYTNGRKLLTPSTGGGSLQAVHGIRTLSMMCIVIGHLFEQHFGLPAINRANFLNYYSDLTHIGIQNYTHAVDTFFVLSGLLVSYIFLRGKAKGEPFNIPLYYLHRYIRLTPAFAVMILLTATLLGHAGDGPLWEIDGNYSHEKCIHNWWINLIYLNNYVKPLEGCLIHTWYLAADMQLYILSPLILLPLWRWPHLWKHLIGGLILAGILINFLVTIIIDPYAYPLWKVMLVTWYFPTHMRFVPWAIGIGLGYLLHKTQATPLLLSRQTVAVGWLLSAVLLLGPIFVNRALPDNAVGKVIWLYSLKLALYKPVFALGVAWVIVACSQGYGGPVNTFLSWSVFEVLGRLTYTAYLTHVYFIAEHIGTMRTAVHLSDRSTLMQFAGVLVATFFAAILLSLVFEAPALIIEKLLLGKGEAKDTTAKKYNNERPTPEEHAEGVALVSLPRAVNKSDV